MSITTKSETIVIIVQSFIFPEGGLILNFEDDKSFQAIKKAFQEKKQVGVIAESLYNKALRGEKNLLTVMCEIKNVVETEKTVELIGVSRARFMRFLHDNFGMHLIVGEVSPIVEKKIFRDKVEKGSDAFVSFALLYDAINNFRLMKVGSPESFDNKKIKEMHLGHLVDYLSLLIPFNKKQVEKILEATDPVERCRVFLSLLVNFYVAWGKTTQEVVQKVIKKDKKDSLVDRFNKIKGRISREGRAKIKEEFGKIKIMKESDSSYPVVKNWLEFVMSIFANQETEECNDIKKIKLTLEEDHYGLKPIKDVIIEYVATKILNPDRKALILCFVGPPGTGKTSLGRSIAKSLNRKFYRWSVGGVTRESEIRGHRSTYVGALPGRMIQAIKSLGVNNPLFMIDEVDKMRGAGGISDGDPVSALLEVLDPEQNFSFSDHYVGVPFDLSKVFFIATANDASRIPAPLKDRMEVITLPGYTEKEKIGIASRFLVPRQIKLNGLEKVLNLSFSTGTLSRLITEYTAEAGVRKLESRIEKVCRVLAVEVAEGKHHNQNIKVRSGDLERFLGQPTYSFDELGKNKVGVSIAMAWTASGGRILFVESKIRAPSQRPEIFLTGNLGGVMKESAQIALTFLIGIMQGKGLGEDINKLYHLHVPAGAIPKDGPSAGLAILFSLYSLFNEKKVKESLAVTGEISLRGKVLPVGGIKEKVLGAIRVGVKEIILPKSNASDLIGLPKEDVKKIEFHLVENIKEAIKIAFK